MFAGRFKLLEPIVEGGMGAVGALLRFVREQTMRLDHTCVAAPEPWAGMDDHLNR